MSSNWQATQAELEAVLANVAEGLAVFDAKGHVLYLNPAALRFENLRELRAGYSHGVELRRYFTTLRLLTLEGRVLSAEERPIARLLRGESFQDLELRVQFGDKTEVVRLNGQAVKRDTGDVSLAVLSFRDLTREREAEALSETVFQAAPVPIAVMWLEDARYLDVNQAFLQTLDYTRDEVVGRTALELDLIVEAERRAPALAKLKRRESVGPIEITLRTGSGNHKTVLATSRSLDLGGELCALSTFIDVTERKRAEKRLSEATASVMQNAAMFSRSVVEQLERLRAETVQGGGDNSAQATPHLTKREKMVLALLAEGRSNGEIAEALSLSGQTVRNYVNSLYKKLGVRTRAEAIVWARDRGLISLS